MNLTDNELSHIVHNKKIPQEIKDKIYFEVEKTKLIQTIDNCNDAFIINEINDIISSIINDRDKIEQVGLFIFDKYKKDELEKSLTLQNEEK